MRVLQSDYESFYSSIINIIKMEENNAHSSQKVNDRLYNKNEYAAAAEPKRSILEKKIDHIKWKYKSIERDIKNRTEPYDEDISLSGKEYGLFIDNYYKTKFVQLTKEGKWSERVFLQYQIAEEIQRRKGNDIILRIKGRNNNISFWEKIKNLIGI